MNLFNSKSRKHKFLVCFLVFTFQVLFVNAQVSSRYSKIIPKPVSIYNLKGEFLLNQNTVIEADNPDDKNLNFLVNYISKSLGIKTSSKPDRKKNDYQTIIR